MKSIKVIVIGFILAIALVAWPVEYTRNITAGTGFLLGGVLAAWLGIRRRKGARKEYEDDVQRYTGTTMMKVVWRNRSLKGGSTRRTAVIGCAGRRTICRPMSTQ